MTENATLKMEEVSFAYGQNQVLNHINYEFSADAIVGKSGAGKTTLLSLLSGLTHPTGGRILCNEKDLRNINPYDYRRKYVGVIFQSFNLLTKLTAAENVELSMDIAKYPCTNKKKRSYELLESVGLRREEADRRVLKLSGGQQQRVAITRDLSYEPDFILADDLDGETQNEIMAILRGLAAAGKCIIIVTHSPSVAQQADVIYRLTAVEAV